MAKTTALILAAGQGERAKIATETVPKQYRLLAGKPVLRWSLEAFLGAPGIDAVQTVISEGARGNYDAAAAGLNLPRPITGGATRQDSVRKGLEALAPSPPDLVLIHDGARPFVSRVLIARVLSALQTCDAVAPFLAVHDTLRRKGVQGFEAVDRGGLLRAQTPQGFRFAAILAAHQAFTGGAVSDDFALAERAGLALGSVPGAEENMKLTTAEDFCLAERIALARQQDIRTGTGFDVHRFGPGDHVWLCGIKIGHSAGLIGHSDADVGLHALTDAILGAIAAEDIGVHFPPSDERWRNAPSHLFLAHAASLARARGGSIAHIDVTLICEAPRIGPHREAMRARIAELLALDVGRVSIKATTTEGLGFTGRGEGIAAQAVATVRLP